MSVSLKKVTGSGDIALKLVSSRSLPEAPGVEGGF